MEKKIFQAPFELIAAKESDDGMQGEFRAVFSRFNVIDLDRDVTLPGAFTDGQKVRIAYWGHRWHDLPVGRGVIHSDNEKAWVDGVFFLDTEAGQETYRTVKNLGDLQEWSYGFDILDSENGKFGGEDVRFLKALKVFEVSPVLLGAGIGTQTVAIKGTSQEPGSDLGDPGEDPSDGKPEDGSDTEAAASGKANGLTPEVVMTDVEIGLQLIEVEK